MEKSGSSRLVNPRPLKTVEPDTSNHPDWMNSALFCNMQHDISMHAYVRPNEIARIERRPLFFAFTRFHNIYCRTDHVGRNIDSSHNHIFGHADRCTNDASAAEKRQQSYLRKHRDSFFHFIIPIKTLGSSLQGTTRLPTPSSHEFRLIRLGPRHFRSVIHDYFPTKSVI